MEIPAQDVQVPVKIQGDYMAIDMEKVADWIDCPVCLAKGKVLGVTCPNCSGYKYVLKCRPGSLN